jgi:hypothetical protein
MTNIEHRNGKANGQITTSYNSHFVIATDLVVPPYTKSFQINPRMVVTNFISRVWQNVMPQFAENRKRK